MKGDEEEREEKGRKRKGRKRRRRRKREKGCERAGWALRPDTCACHQKDLRFGEPGFLTKEISGHWKRKEEGMKRVEKGGTRKGEGREGR